MALATLSVNLDLALAKFEADSGRAAQVVARDQDKMSRSARAFTAQIERMASQANKTNVELLTIQGAAAGVDDATLKLIQTVRGAGGAFATIGATGAQAFASVSAGADATSTKVSALLATMVEKTRELKSQSDAARAAAVSQNQGGSLTDDGLKARLASIRAATDAEQQRLRVAYEADKQAARVAADEDAALRKRVAAFAPLGTAIASADKAAKGFAATSKLSAFEAQQLSFQLHDLAVQTISGQNFFVALAQQGSQVAGTFGSTGNALKAVASLVTPARVALTATAAAVGGLALAFYEGSKQSRAFADSVVLTGNFAGLTEGQFNNLAKTIAASGQVSISAVREFGQALVSTGEIGPKNFSAAAEAAARFGAATGKNAKEVSTDFASMGADVSKWATEHNRQLNFVTAAQLQQIRTLQEQGRATEAQAIVYEALNTRLKALEPNLGTIERVLRTGSNAWKAFWDSAYDVGRTETIEDKIAKARAAIANGVGEERVSQTQLDPQRRAQLGVGDQSSEAKENARENLRLLLRQQSAGEQIAADAAELAKLQKDAANADDFVAQNQRRAKSQEGLRREIAAANAEFARQDKLAARDSSYTPSSAQTRADILKKIREDYTDKPAVGEADAQRKALLDQDLKFTKDNLEQQTDLLKFNQQVVAAIYAGNNISLKDYYDERRKLTQEGVDNQLNALIDEQARLEVELQKGQFKDPHEKIAVQTQLNESIVKYAKVQREASQAAVAANLDELAARTALNDRIVEYRANLLAAEGDEAGAANLRAQQTIAAARLFAQVTSGTQTAITEDDLARQERAIAAANRFAEVQRKVGTATADASRAEEAFLLRATQSGLNQLQTDTGIYQIRAASVVQLGELADKARALADASTDPRVLAYADDLALAYAKAADAVDPAINRIRSGADDLAKSFSSVFESISSGSVTGSDAMKQLGKNVQQIFTRTFISEPFEAALKGAFRKAVDGGGLGALLRSGAPSAKAGAGIDVAGAGYSPATDSQAASEAFDSLSSSVANVVSSTVTQTTATQTATSALAAMSAAAQSAASALATVSASAGGSGFSGLSGGGGFGTGADFGNQDYGAFLAEGTNYVPHDGMRAVLHKGESVVPAKYNPAAGGSAPGGGVQVVVNNMAGDTTQASAEQKSDGSIEVIVRKIVRSEFHDDLRRSGSMSSGIKSKFGLQPVLPRRA